MKEFKIFIASSNDEKDERNTFGSFLSTVSKETRNFGIEFTPVMWEMESVNFSLGLTPKQNEYNEKLKSSDMAFFLFGKRVGKYTKEEFISHWGITDIENKHKGIVMFLKPADNFNQLNVDQCGESRSFIFLFSYIKQYKRYFAQIIGGLILGCILQLIMPFLTQSINS